MPSCCMLLQGDQECWIADRGLSYGDGLFETMAVEKGRVAWLESHLQRLSEGCRRLGFNIDREWLSKQIERFCRQRQRAVCKLTVTRGRGDRGYRPSENPLPTIGVQLFDYPTSWVGAEVWGIDTRFCHTRLSRNPLLAGIKHLCRLEQVLGARELGSMAVEGVMRDTDGWVIEGTCSNLFVVENDTLITPDLSNAGVAGIMRSRVLDLVPETRVEGISKQRVIDADELFLCNAVQGIVPVANLDGRRWLSLGKMTSQISEAFGR